MYKIFFVLPVWLVASLSISDAADRPNIIVIMADDMGYADAGFTGSKKSSRQIWINWPRPGWCLRKVTRIIRFADRRVLPCFQDATNTVSVSRPILLMIPPIRSWESIRM